MVSVEIPGQARNDGCGVEIPGQARNDGCTISHHETVNL